MIKLDEKDIRILAALERRGRITKSELAEEVHLSPSPCYQRMKRLESLGAIQSYHAKLGLEKVCKSNFVFAILSLENPVYQRYIKFETKIKDIPEVMACYPISGESDYLLKIVVRDMSHYQAILESLLDSDLGIGAHMSFFVLGPIFERAGHPLDELINPSAQ